MRPCWNVSSNNKALEVKTFMTWLFSHTHISEKIMYYGILRSYFPHLWKMTNFFKRLKIHSLQFIQCQGWIFTSWSISWAVAWGLGIITITFASPIDRSIAEILVRFLSLLKIVKFLARTLYDNNTDISSRNCTKSTSFIIKSKNQTVLSSYNHTPLSRSAKIEKIGKASE